MGYTHGKFTWFTLHSNDVPRATAFYTELFGWGTENMDMPEGSYTIFKNGEAGIGGVRKPPHAGAPSHWISYVSVPDVDATAKKVRAGGGNVLSEPFDIPTVGRVAAVTDREGAAFLLFKGEEGDAPDGPSTAGGFAWNELWTSDPASAKAFYQEHLGYTTEAMAMPQGEYTILKKDDTPRGGLMKSPEQGVPPMWLGYVHVDDADATAKRATDLGGELIAEPMDVEGVGRFGVLKDPTGAVLGFITPAQK